MSGISDMVHELLGCAWGRKLWSKDDSALCGMPAVKMVALHEGSPDYIVVKLCQDHLDVVMAESTPRPAD